MNLVCVVLGDRTFPRVAFLPEDTPDMPVIRYLAALSADGANAGVPYEECMEGPARAFLAREFPHGRTTTGEDARWAAWDMTTDTVQAIPAGAVVTALYVLDRQFIEM